MSKEADEKVRERRDEKTEHDVLLHVHAVGDEAVDDLAYRIREQHRRADIPDLRRRVCALLYHPLLRRGERKAAHVERRVDEQHRRHLPDARDRIPSV